MVFPSNPLIFDDSLAVDRFMHELARKRLLSWRIFVVERPNSSGDIDEFFREDQQ